MNKSQSTKKFSVLVTRTDEYEIEINTDVWTPEAIAEWSKTFQEAETASDIAAIIAGRVVGRVRNSEFFEGFGHLELHKRFENEDQPLTMERKVEAFNPNFKVMIISEGEERDIEVEEIE